MHRGFLAFENESDSFVFGDMTIENRLDRVSIYGSLDITKDEAGLQHALKLKRIIDASIDALKREKSLPDKLETPPGELIKNPF